ncbi:MAG: hypothetical protein IKG85_07125 [Clostridia bacterium]|nr:hypothetical protein [Clostridia bacterium]
MMQDVGISTLILDLIVGISITALLFVFRGKSRTVKIIIYVVGFLLFAAIMLRAWLLLHGGENTDAALLFSRTLI